MSESPLRELRHVLECALGEIKGLNDVLFSFSDSPNENAISYLAGQLSRHYE